MGTQGLQVYGYRWIVLLLFFLVNVISNILWTTYAPVTTHVNVISNILWTTYAPVTTHAMEFYGVDEFLVIFISLVFLIVYIPITFLATWLIDKYEFKIGASIGALLMGVFGFLRFIAGNNYILALIISIKYYY